MRVWNCLVQVTARKEKEHKEGYYPNICTLVVCSTQTKKVLFSNIYKL